MPTGPRSRPQSSNCAMSRIWPAETLWRSNWPTRGITIDKAIMVWGWDPLKTMLTRQMYGYTWAPNMNQGNVSTPGITLLGQTPYDPKSPPPASIAVNTDFAKGTVISDPWSAAQLQGSASQGQAST